MSDVVFICETCCLKNGQMPGAEFATLLRADLEKDDIAVRLVSCMNMCDEPMSLALAGKDKPSYLFADVHIGDVCNAAVLARLYHHAENGEITDARPAGRLRMCLKGKVPALK